MGTHGGVVKHQPGGWFNKNMSFYQYRKSHCGDKTISRLSYLHNGISYTGKMTSLYWIRALISPTWSAHCWAATQIDVCLENHLITLYCCCNGQSNIKMLILKYNSTFQGQGWAWLSDICVPFSLYWPNFMCPSMCKGKKMIILCAFWNVNVLKDLRCIVGLSLTFNITEFWFFIQCYGRKAMNCQ